MLSRIGSNVIRESCEAPGVRVSGIGVEARVGEGTEGPRVGVGVEAEAGEGIDNPDVGVESTVAVGVAGGAETTVCATVGIGVAAG